MLISEMVNKINCNKDGILSEDDKKAIDETLEAEKKDKLKSMDEVFD